MTAEEKKEAWIKRQLDSAPPLTWERWAAANAALGIKVRPKNAEEIILADIRQVDAELEEIIGRKAFGHISAPTPTSTRITFGDGHVCLTLPEAQAYMHALLVTARADPAKLPWPLNEPPA